MTKTTTSPTPGNTEAAKVYSKLLRDPRISLGGFKLFHALRSYRNKETGLTCPGQETLIEEMGFNKPSLKKWTGELEAAGYIWTEKRGQNHHLVYHFTTDCPKPVDAPELFRSAGLPRLAVQKPIPPRSAETCTVTNPKEPTSVTNPRSDAPADAKRVNDLLSGVVKGLVAKASVHVLDAPSLEDIRTAMNQSIPGSGRHAEAFMSRMRESNWTDECGRPIQHKIKRAVAYANSCALNQIGLGKPRRPFLSATVASPSSCASRSRQAENQRNLLNHQ